MEAAPPARCEPVAALSWQVGRWLRSIAVCAVAWWWLTAGFLLWRRLTADWGSPASAKFWIGSALVVAWCAWCLRRLIAAGASSLGPSQGATERWYSTVADSSRIAVSLPLLVISACVSLPDGPALGIAGWWCVILLGELCCGSPRGAWSNARSPTDALHPTAEAGPAIQPEAASATRESTNAAPVLPTAEQESLSSSSAADMEGAEQAMSRQTVYAHDEQEALVSGWLLADFAAGQRVAVEHVTFQPPFDGPPSVEAEALVMDEGELLAQTSVTRSLAWGARFEIKLSAAPAAPCRVRLEFTARRSLAAVDDGFAS